MERFPPATDEIRNLFTRIDVVGDSLITDYGPEHPDFSAIRRIAALINPARLNLGAQNGSLCSAPEAVTYGGYGYVLKEFKREEFGAKRYTTLSAASSVGAITLSITAEPTEKFQDGDRISIGKGGTQEVARIQSGAGTTTLTLDRALASAHASGDPVFVTGHPYLPRTQLGIISHSGYNDLGRLGPGAKRLGPFKHCLEAIISRLRQAVWFDDAFAAGATQRHSSIIYTTPANWATAAGTTGYTVGDTYTYSSTVEAGDEITLVVPADFPGGTAVLGWVVSASANVGCVFDIAVTGATTKNLSALRTKGSATENYLPISLDGSVSSGSYVVHRITGLNAGAHEIKINLTAVDPFGAIFDGWGIEAIPAPLLLVISPPRGTTYGTTSIYKRASKFNTETGASECTLSGAHAQGVTSLTITPGLDRAGETGSTVKVASEYYELAADALAAATTITITPGLTTAKSGNEDVQVGFQDRDLVDSANSGSLSEIIKSVLSGFPSGEVKRLDLDRVYGQDEGNFIDGIHPNEEGAQKVAAEVWRQLQAAQWPASTILAPNVSDARSWYEVGKGGTLPAFKNSWVNNGAAGEAPTSFTKDVALGIVNMRGSVKSGTSATAVVFTLPVGYRPRYPIIFSGRTSTGAVVGRVAVNGDVSFINGGSTTLTEFYTSFLAEA